MKVTLTRVTQNPIRAIEEAASNCYDSEPTSDGRIMKDCYNSGHHSVLEFADFTFHVEGLSRATSHQLVRHRIASYAQRSQRYVLEDGFKYVVPDSIKNNWGAGALYYDLMKEIDYVYKTLMDMGIPSEDARFVLPNACETIVEIKMNTRTLINFMNERLCTRSQWEIREMAKLMKKCLMEYDEECAEIAKFCVPKCYAHPSMPFCVERKKCDIAPKLKDIYKAYLSTKEGDTNEK